MDWSTLPSGSVGWDTPKSEVVEGGSVVEPVIAEEVGLGDENQTQQAGILDEVGEQQSMWLGALPERCEGLDLPGLPEPSMVPALLDWGMTLRAQSMAAASAVGRSLQAHWQGPAVFAPPCMISPQSLLCRGGLACWRVVRWKIRASGGTCQQKTRSHLLTFTLGEPITGADDVSRGRTRNAISTTTGDEDSMRWF